MILNDTFIINWAIDNVDPFEPLHVNPASLDLTLGGDYKDLLTGEKYTLAPNEQFVINPGDAILASTTEYICMPETHAGTIYLKSSLARLGLDHALAGWIDPGFEGEITLELHAHRPVILTRGQRICQLVLSEMIARPAISYKVRGRYNKQRGPTEARYDKRDSWSGYSRTTTGKE